MPADEPDVEPTRRTLRGLTAARLLAGDPVAAGESQGLAAQRREQQRAERAGPLALESRALARKQAAPRSIAREGDGNGARVRVASLGAR